MKSSTGNRRERLVLRGAARAELQRDARHRDVVRRLDDVDEVVAAERRPLRLDAGAELLELLVDLADPLRVVLDRRDAFGGQLGEHDVCRHRGSCDRLRRVVSETEDRCPARGARRCVILGNDAVRHDTDVPSGLRPGRRADRARGRRRGDGCGGPGVLRGGRQLGRRDHRLGLRARRRGAAPGRRRDRRRDERRRRRERQHDLPRARAAGDGPVAQREGLRDLPGPGRDARDRDDPLDASRRATSVRRSAARAR